MYDPKTGCMWNVCGMFKGVSEGEYGCMTILDLMGHV